VILNGRSIEERFSRVERQMRAVGGKGKREGTELQLWKWVGKWVVCGKVRK
jgi:hypothetical protein